MTITTDNEWIAATRQDVILKKTASVTVGALVGYSLLDVAGQPGAGDLNIGNTANGLVPTQATAGFPPIQAFGAGNLGYLYRASCTSSVVAHFRLYDRLFHAGSFTLSTGGTFNLTAQPSYASRLPGTDYNGLEILIEVNAAVSATSTTCTVTYTNEAGTTGRTTQTSPSLLSNGTRTTWQLGLQQGDKGVQKVDALNITGQAATLGTVNVIVARKLAQFDVRVTNNFGRDIQGPDLTCRPIITQDAGLWPVVWADSTASGLSSFFLGIRDG